MEVRGYLISLLTLPSMSYSYDRTAHVKVASVIDSLLIMAKDHGAKTLKTFGGFGAKFPSEKKVEAFLRNANMEYPKIGSLFRQRTLDDGRILLELSPRDASKFEK